MVCVGGVRFLIYVMDILRNPILNKEMVINHRMAIISIITPTTAHKDE